MQLSEWRKVVYIASSHLECHNPSGQTNGDLPSCRRATFKARLARPTPAPCVWTICCCQTGGCKTGSRSAIHGVDAQNFRLLKLLTDAIVRKFAPLADTKLASTCSVQPCWRCLDAVARQRLR